MEERFESSKITRMSDSVSFGSFIWKNKFNRSVVVVCILSMLFLVGLFKYYYPFAGFINGDSYAYIVSAANNLKIDTYPIGYPKFLRLFSVFSSDDTTLVVFQYLFVQLNALLLILSLFYFYPPYKWIFILTVGLMTLNPVILYLANYVSSDIIFLGLSLCWLTLLIWILHRPSWWLIFVHALIVTISFLVRYNALFYPLISLFAFFLKRDHLKLKLVGIGVAGSLIGVFVLFTSLQYKNFSGKAQFSPFSGWQLANNAMYAYKFIDSADRKKVPAKFAELDKDVRNYFDSTKIWYRHPEEMIMAGTLYMWSPKSPLRIYMAEKYKNDSTISDQKRWAQMGPYYEAYGRELIKMYPATFVKKYLCINFLKYYAPPIEFLGAYNSGIDTVRPVAVHWFGYSSTKISAKASGKQVNVLNYYPIIVGATNVIFVMMSIVFLIFGGRRSGNGFFQVWMLVTAFWIINLLFSVYASPVALRFQVFPFMLCFIFNLMLLDYVLKAPDSKDKSLVS
ncbi:hypothetical protein [Chitinophaga sp. HK235]|uniref:hypothetical protein n=1 Tax=Chitinophaga sp. HK235 TaxID=2952571 RepID=UPI001BA88A1B|nr:hypothetical protein [Chitinophaga sp. HK235]